MKKIIGYFIIFLIGGCFYAFLLNSCSSAPGGGSSSSSGEPGGASGVLSGLPDLKLKNLPDSLAAGSDLKSKSKVTRRWTKAEGDVTVFNPATMPDVKAQGWVSMHDQLQMNIVMIFMDVLKRYASNNTIPYDTDVHLGIQPLILMGMTMYMDMGWFRCSEITNNHHVVYWSMPISGGTNTNVGYLYMDIVKDGSGFIKVDFFALMGGEGAEEEIYYSLYNEVSNEILNYSYRSTSQSINRVYSDGSGMILLNFYSSSDETNISIAWGDNSKGGLINASEYIGPSWTNSYLRTEYYNGDGSLVFNSWGSGNLNDTKWLDSYTENGTNLKDLYFTTPLPAFISVIYDYSGPTVVYVSNWSTGETNIISNDIWNFYYQESSPDWNSGDAVYWWDYGTNIGSTYIYTMKKGYTVPSSKTYFGKSYYMENNWPLKYLELEPAFSSFQINRRELSTQSYIFTNVWTDIDGNYITNINNWTWTDYEWWLDGTPDTNLDPTDVRLLNIRSDEVWIWNGTSMDKQSNYVVYGSDLSPMYFDFVPAAASIVEDVNLTISNIYEDFKTFDIIGFTNNIPPLPDTNLFPVLR